MTISTRSLSIVVRTPFEPDRFAGDAAAPISAEQRASYLQALRREVASGAEDALESRVSLVLFSGGTPANMTLATWCYLMDDIMACYKGVPTAHVRFDAEPRLINHKTAQYAHRWHSLFNMLVPDFADPAAPWGREDAGDAIAEALEHMVYEKCAEWGVETTLPQADGAAAQKAADVLVARLGFYKPGYIRLHRPDAALAPCIADALSSCGYRASKGGLFANHAKYASWFIENETDDVLGFGVGTLSRIGGVAFKTCGDVSLYCEQAGVSAAIYELA